jgi:SAM-dependent methyltransferase
MDADFRQDSSTTRQTEGPAVRQGPAGGRQPSLVDYDAELRLHNEQLRRAYGFRLEDRVLDIGCGTGQMTRDAARLAVSGSALGVDISAPAIQRARELSDAEGLRNVTYERADASCSKLTPDEFELAFTEPADLAA